MSRTPGLPAVSAATLLAVALLLLRFRLEGTDRFAPLAFNLLLAWVPFLLSARLRDRPPGARRWLVAAGWLLFLPNAPYLLTDLLYLKHRPPVPLWFDVALFGAFVYAGLLLAGWSLAHVLDLAQQRQGSRSAWALIGAACALSGLGVYLGRVQRWNSWDAVTQPGALLLDVAHQLSQPGLWGMTLVYGAITFVTVLGVRRPASVPV